MNELAEHPMQKPYLNDARTKMASRDFSFRDAYHGNIADYLQAVTPEEFERFIGDQSIDFDRILADNKDVLKRLKQAEESKGIIYIDYDEALNIYGKMIDASDGGFEGVRDEGGIRATLDFVQNDLYYPTFVDKLTYLMYRFCSGHFFNDGNKRIALTLGAYFLHKNNYYWHACICMRTLESIIYHVAASNIDQDLLLRIVNSFMTSKDYDEELKIDIANAMDKGELGIQGENYEQDKI